MRYFSYIAEQSFKTSPTGERLFFRSGPWSKPFIIPDAETEQKLFRKQLWLMRILLGFLILGQPFLFQIFPATTKDSTAFISYLVLITLLWYGISHLVFRSELGSLKRAESRMPLKAFLNAKAEKHSVFALILGVLGCILFVACGVWMFNAGESSIIALLCIGFFGLCGLAWGYALYLKIQK